MSKPRKLRVVGDEYEPTFLKPENNDELKAREKASKYVAKLQDRDFGISDENATAVLRQDVARVMPDTAGLFHYNSRERHDAAFALIEGMGPRNAKEALLAANAVIGHNLGVDLAFHASYGRHIEPQERDILLRGFQRLNNVTIRSVLALDKLQSRQQNDPERSGEFSDSEPIITREHVERILSQAPKY